MDNKEIARNIIQDHGRLSSDRGNFESHWREIAELMFSGTKDNFQSMGPMVTKGNKRTQEIYDSTAALALGKFGAILDSLLTPRNQTWHRLQTSDSVLNKDRSVKEYFENVNHILFRERYAATSNFQSQNQTVYKNLGAFGTGALFIDELSSKDGLRYKSVYLNELHLKENHQGVVDTVLRYFTLTARQAIQQWGAKCPESIQLEAKKNSEREFSFIHCVKPREDIDYTRKDFKGMEFASYYVSVEEQVVVSEGGYNTFPYATSRYEQFSGEVYGRSPAMDVLPAIKTLNQQKKTMLKQGHRAVDPVLLLHDDGVMDAFSLKSGALNYGAVSAEGRPLVHTLPTGNFMIGKDMMDEERQTINDAFLITLFQVLIETPQQTATEVLERAKEKGILLAPTLGRQQSEYLGPMISREIDVLSSIGKLPPMPPVLREASGEYRIEYDSPLSRLQRAEESAGLARVLDQTLNIVNITQNPAYLDFFNFEEIIPGIADDQGVPSRYINSEETRKKLAAARAQQAQQQQALDAAPAMAGMMKNLNGGK